MNTRRATKVFASEGSQIVGISPWSLVRMVFMGRLRAERVGRQGVFVFRRADLEALAAYRRRTLEPRRRAEHAKTSQKGGE